jgi:uncharacterized protein (DUF4415 family)
MTANRRSSNAPPGSIGSDLAKVGAYVNTAADYDEAPGLDDAFFAEADVHIGGALVRKGGRPKSPAPKQPVSIRLSSRVLDYYRSQGAGWQTRLNADLESIVAKRARGSDQAR